MSDDEDKVLPAKAISRAITGSSSENIRKLTESGPSITEEIVESVPKLDDILKVPADAYVKSADEADQSSQIESANEEPDLQGAQLNHPAWLPKKEQTLRRWWKVYSIMLSLDEEYWELLDSGDTKNPKPTMADYQLRIYEELKITYSPKTIGRIKQAGDNGWITEPIDPE